MMVDWLSLATFSIYVILVSLLVFNNIRLAHKNNKMAKDFAQTLIDNVILNDKVQDLLLADRPETTEGFIKFLSESRDWAFTYIEDVQQSISSLKTAVENGYPTEEEMKKLFDFLPEKNKENNE